MQHVSQTPPSGQNQTIDQKLLFQMQLFHKILRRLQRRLFKISPKGCKKGVDECMSSRIHGQNFVAPGPVRDSEIFLGPGPVPGSEVFLGPGPVWSEISKIFPGLVRGSLHGLKKPTHIDCLANFRGRKFRHLTFEIILLTSNDLKSC